MIVSRERVCMCVCARVCMSRVCVCACLCVCVRSNPTGGWPSARCIGAGSQLPPVQPPSEKQTGAPVSRGRGPLPGARACTLHAHSGRSRAALSLGGTCVSAPAQGPCPSQPSHASECAAEKWGLGGAGGAGRGSAASGGRAGASGQARLGDHVLHVPTP